MTKILVEQWDREDLQDLVRKEVIEGLNGVQLAGFIEHKEEIITAKQLLEILRISQPTIDKLRKLGTLIAYRISGCTRIFYKRSQVIDALEPIKKDHTK